MSAVAIERNRARRRAEEHDTTRSFILEAARRVGTRLGARQLSLRAVAAEAGFAPAALYGYFAGKDELLLALAADDLGACVRAMRDAAGSADAPGSANSGRLRAAAAAALDWLQHSEALAHAPAAFSGRPAPEAERLFNGRLIAMLKALSDAAGTQPDSRAAQADIVLLAASLTGLAVLAGSGRLDALGFSTGDILDRLDTRFAS